MARHRKGIRTTSPVCEFPTLTGRQEPHRLSAFEGDDRRGESAVRLAGRVGRRSMPWQVSALFGILRINPLGLWTHPDVVLIVPRQNGKTLIVILRVLFGLFVLNERIVYTAQRWKSAEDAHNRLWDIIRKRPSLLKRVMRHTISQGNGYIELASGGKVLFCTRSADAGRGLDEVDLIVYDEAYNLTEAEVAALNPTQLAAQNPQTIYTSSPVNKDQHPNGYVLAGLRRQGLAYAEALLFIEYAAPADMPRDAEATWEYANPSYGVIQNAAKVRKILRTATTAAGRKTFDVEILGRGDYPVAAEDIPPLIGRDMWMAMRNPSPTLVGPRALAIDMTPDRTTLSIVGAQWTTQGRVHLDLGYHGDYTTGAVKYVVGVVGRMDPCVLVIDRNSPAFSMVPDLANAGLEVTVTDAGQAAQGTGDFYDKAKGALLDHTGDPLWLEGVEGAVKRDLPGGGWLWDRKGENTISQVVAGSGALWGLLNYGTRVAPVQELVHGSTEPSDTFDADSSPLAVGF